MEERTNTFDLSPEQQDTASLLRRLLGKSISDRYVDFCRTTAGAFALNVSRPVAAHMMRELESLLRFVLEVPMEVRAAEPPEDVTRTDEARSQLVKLGFDEPAIQRAVNALKPRLTHKAQIRKIVERLGLNPQGDIANRWVSLCDAFGRAHERSFHSSLAIDEEFKVQYQQPFDTVVRAIAAALEGSYIALMRRVEALAIMPDKAKGAAAFAREIPGAEPLQWHFFKRLDTADWLPHLAKEGLLREPHAPPEDDEVGSFRYRQWPAGDYLKRMAGSSDPTVREGVVEALRQVAKSQHPDIRGDGLEILAALPAEEAAPLADIAVAWLAPETSLGSLQAPETLVRRLAAANQSEAALCVARGLLQLWDKDNHIASLYSRYMYEHHLPPIAFLLTSACGEDALRFLADLLARAAEISGKVRYDHYAMHPIADDAEAPHDIYHALLSAARRSAVALVERDPTRMRPVIAILISHSSNIFKRLALHVLAQNPSAAPDLAESNLLDAEVIEATWCRAEYAELTSAWFPSLAPNRQAEILEAVDSLPDKYLEAWSSRFQEHQGSGPTLENERQFAAITIRDALWSWRSVLPPDRQEALNRIVAEFGDPDAWRKQLFPVEESPLGSAEFARRPASNIAAFLRQWRPKGQQCQTITALAQELRTAVGNNPIAFVASADKFRDLKPIYVRRLLEGLQNIANNQGDFDWGPVLRLVEHTYAQYKRPIDPATLFEGDDKSWAWACMTASELLAAGLRRGVSGIGFEHRDMIRSLIFTVLELAPADPELEDFEERFDREPFFAAQGTLRGAAVELCILMMFWLSKDGSSAIGAAPREALQNLPEIRRTLEIQLADTSASGRIPRAIMGRYLRFLFFFGEDWLRAQMPIFFPPSDDRLRLAAWRAHLGHDQGPLADFVTELHSCLAEDIARLGSDQTDRNLRDFYEERLADYVILLFLWDALPEDLLGKFWRDAPASVRQHAMWFIGKQVSAPSNIVPAAVKARGLAYWESRLAKAGQSDRPDEYRAELGVLSQWCFHGQVGEQWLCDQLLRMLLVGFAPSDASSVVEWLGKIAPRHLDRSVEALSALLRHPRLDQWAYMTEREPIRGVLAEGLARGTPATVKRVRETIGFLSTLGETSYLDLIPPSGA